MKVVRSAVVAWALVGMAASADPLPPDGEERSEKPYTAVIDVQSTGPITYLDPLFVSIRVTPLRSIDVEDIFVLPLGALKKLYEAGLDTSLPEPARRCRFGANAGAAKRSFVATCELGDLVGPRAQLLNPVVALPPSRQKLAIEIQVRQDGGLVSYYDEAFVDLAPPRIGIVYGGFVGSLLLAVFTALRAFLDRPAGERVGPLAWTRATIVGSARAFWRTVAMSLVGGICALLVILLTQVTEGLEPPISIHVQDFWGGVVVGLFSIPMSAWLADRMRLGTSPRTADADAPAPPPVPAPAAPRA